MFRILRAARPLRTINQIPALRIVIETFGNAGLPLANAVTIMFAALYMLCSKRTAHSRGFAPSPSSLFRVSPLWPWQ